MPRTISAAMLTHLAGEALTLCTCVKITRKDTTVLGFTNINKQVVIDGVTYHPSGAIGATAMHASADSGVDNLDITGFIDSELIVASDVIGGLYNSADVQIFRVNYEDLTMGKINIFSGKIGEISVTDEETFTAELLSLSSMLKQSIGDVTSATCRVRKFGDTQCKLNISSYTFSKSVSAVASAVQFTLGSTSQATGYFDYGTVQFTSGDNRGLIREIKEHTLSGGSAVIKLRRAFPFAVGIGDAVTIIRGCDRRFETCIGYGNAINFRGEPHLPGNDTIMKVGRIPD